MGRCACGLAVFVCGAAVMVFELVGSRVLAPYAGTSLHVWTNLLGVILASLSVGYWAGGAIADRRPDARLLSALIFAAAACVGLTALFRDRLLPFLQVRVEGPGALSLIASLALFAPANVFLGTVPPFAARLRIRDAATSGSAVGALYALSALGSIAGTFLAGFVLIPSLGSGRLLFATSAALGLLSLAFRGGATAGARAGLLLIFLAMGGRSTDVARKGLLLDIDTPYNRVWVCEGSDESTGRPIRSLSTDPYGQESAIYLDGDDLVFDYHTFFRLAEHFVPGFRRVLLVGGAAYAYPSHFLRRYPDARIDVIEIDPALTEISRRHFNLRDNPRLAVRHTDGRSYLNRGGEGYDLILIDAFKDANCIPFELTTVEAARRMRDRLSAGGAVLVNIIGSVEGENGRFTRAEYATYRRVFPRVDLFPVDDPGDGRAVQNIILAALASGRWPSPESADAELNRFLGHRGGRGVAADVPVLTDDRAPVEYYLRRVR